MNSVLVMKFGEENGVTDLQDNFGCQLPLAVRYLQMPHCLIALSLLRAGCALLAYYW